MPPGHGDGPTGPAFIAVTAVFAAAARSSSLRTDLSGTALPRLQARNARVDDAELTGAQWPGAQLHSARFAGIDFEAADLRAADFHSLYKRQIERLVEQPTDRTEYKEPDEVAAAYLRALTDEKRLRYMVVPNKREAEMTIKAAIARVVQLNEAQPFAYDREALIKLIDEALAPK